MKIGDKVKLNKNGVSDLGWIQRLRDMEVPVDIITQVVCDHIPAVICDFGARYSAKDVKLWFPDYGEDGYTVMLPSTWVALARTRVTGHHLTDMFKFANALDKPKKV